MAEYINGSTDILGGSVIRYALNTTTPNQAVIRKIIAGNGISISSTGVDPGTGDVTISIDTSGTGGSGAGGGTPTAVGTVTSVNMTAPEGLFVLGAPITNAGTIALRLSSGYIIPLIDDLQKGITAYNDKIVSLSYNTSSGVITLTRLGGGSMIATITLSPFTTSDLAEGTNLYYTNTRARSALSFVAGSGAYNSATGVITIPTNTNQLTNGAGFITGNQNIIVSGDATGSGTTAITLTLATVNSNIGTFNNVTVNAKGLVTAASNIAYQVTSEKGLANGYASLNSSGQIPSTQLPSYVDDVLEYADLAAFPGSGETGKIYVTLDTNKTYRWSGSVYIEISASPGSTDAVAEGSVNLYFTNARARAAISLTTTGDSGASTYSSATGVINVPTYTLTGLGGVPTTRTITINGTSYDLSANRSWSVGTVTGSGSTNVLPKWTSASSIGNSLLDDDGTSASVALASGGAFNVKYLSAIKLALTGGTTFGSIDVPIGLDFLIRPDSIEKFRISSTGLLRLANYGSGSVTGTVTYRLAVDSTGNVIEVTDGGGTVTSVSGAGTVSGLTLTGTVTGSGSLTLGGTLTLTSEQVTTALGYTPYNAANPNGYISSYTETDTLASVTARGATTSTSIAINAILTVGGGADFYLRAPAASSDPGDIVFLDGSGAELHRLWSGANTLYYRTNGGTTYLMWHSGNLTNLNQLSNGPGYITGYTETDTLASVTGRGATTSTATTFLGTLYARKNQTAGDYTTAALWVESYGNTTTGIAFHILNNQGKFLEMRTDGILYWHGSTVWHAGNLTNLNQLSNGPGYITGYSETDTLTSVTGRGASTPANITIANANPVLILKDTDNSGTGVGQIGYISFQDSGNAERAWIGYGSGTSTAMYITNGKGDVILNPSTGNAYVGSNLILHAGNYNSYAPTLTGGGASGTWGISITGNAATLGGYGPNQTGGTNTIVQRDSNGYIQNSYFYMSGGGSERNSSGLGYVAGFNSSDYYVRSYNSTAVASFLGLGSNAYTSTAYLPLTGGTLTGALGGTSATFSSTVTVGAITALAPSGFGYDLSSYKVLIVGPTGNLIGKTLAFGVDVSGNPSGSFSGQGGEYLWRNTATFITPNSSNNGYNTLLSWNSSGQLTFNSAATFSSSVTSTELSYPLTAFNPSLAPRTGLSSMSIKMWDNYFYGTGLGSDYGTVMNYYGRGAHVDTQVYFDAGGGSWYRSASYSSGWQSWQKYLTDGNYNSYAPTLTGGGASGLWSINITGTAGSASSVAWSNVANKPANWLNEPNLIYDNVPDNLVPSGFWQSFQGTGNPTGTWFNYINVRHSNTGNGHGYQLGMSYYDNNLWFRSYQGNGSFLGWSRALGTYTDPYPSNMNQYVRTTDNVNFARVDATNYGVSNAIYFGGGNNYLNWDGARINSNVGIQSASDMRAPIFYDSVNTAYYLDPNSSSVLYSATFNSTVNLQGTNWFGGYGPGSGPGMAFENQGSFLRMAFWGLDFYDWNHGRQMLIDGNYIYVDNYLQAGNSLRAPIFYDSNDTSYYLDPNGNSNLYTTLQYEAKARKPQSDNNYTTAAIWTESYSNTTTGIAFHISGVVGKFLEMRTNGVLYWENNPVITSGNYNSYSPTLTGGGASGTWGISISGNAATATSATSASYSTYLLTNYAGDVYVNPQVYFNNGVGLKVAMTGAWSVWSDTLWINGYTGGDVPNMCALHFLRNGTPRMAISTQSFASTSYGAYYEVLSEYNWTNYAPTKTGGGASGTWGISITGNAATASTSSQVTINYGNDSNSTYYMLWGSGNSIYATGLIYCNPSTDTVYTAAYRGSANVGGTGEASYHPAGIYSSGTQWLYGTTYRNNSATYGQGNLYFDGNYGYGLVGLYSDTRYQAVFAMGDSYKLPADGTTTGSLYGLAWSHPNKGGVAANLNTHGLLVMENGGFLAAVSGSIRARDDMRAPIFYDLGNSGYSLNGDTNSAWRISTPSGYLDIGPMNSSYCHFQTDRGTFYFSTKIEVSGEIWRYGGQRFVENTGTWGISITGDAGSVDGIDSSRIVYGDGARGKSVDKTSGNANVSDSSNPSGFFFGNSTTGMPTTDWWNWINVAGNSWSGGDGYGFQLANSFWGDDLKFRRLQSGTWYSWIQILTSGNISSYAITSLAGETLQQVMTRGASSSTFMTLTGGGTFNSGSYYFKSNKGSGVYLSATNSPPLQAFSDDSGAAFMSFHRSGSYAVNMGLDPDNVMRIGGWSASSNRWQLDMSGNMTVAGDITAYSDARVKTNIKTVEKALEKTLQLRGVTYTRTDSDDKKTKLGVIAQEILEVIPEVVNQDNNGMYNVSYGNLAGVFIEAIKEQQKQIEDLKKQIEYLVENR